ncbi:MAG TPA: endolytic transglycosylase MltG [Trueperaceae bacterium]
MSEERDRPHQEAGAGLSAVGTSGRGSGDGPADGREARSKRDSRDDAVASHGGSPAGRPGSRRGRSFFRGVIVTLLLAVVALGGLVVWGLMPVSDTPQLVEFEVLPGWGASRVADELAEEELIRNATLFSLYLRMRGLDRSIGEGLYDLDRAASAPELAQTLVEGGRPRVARVLLPEGIRAGELAERLEEAGLHDAEEYRRLIDNPGELRPDYVPEGASLEGYLFPASYEIPYSEPPALTLERMIERFERELTEAVRQELERLDMSVHEWVTLASIVQAEAGSTEEMPVIAGVFRNRLDQGMALQSDPTVAYGLGKSLQELDPLAGDMESDHPWNTYTRPGLPQGPISSPGHAALQAVLSPVRTNAQGEDYLYFIHGFHEGEIVFRPNIDLESHNEDVAQYLR